MVNMQEIGQNFIHLTSCRFAHGALYELHIYMEGQWAAPELRQLLMIMAGKRVANDLIFTRVQRINQVCGEEKINLFQSPALFLSHIFLTFIFVQHSFFLWQKAGSPCWSPKKDSSDTYDNYIHHTVHKKMMDTFGCSVAFDPLVSVADTVPLVWCGWLTL